MDNLSTTTRSVPTTPLGLSATTAHLLKSGSPLAPDLQSLGARIGTPGSQQLADTLPPNDLQASLSRLPSGTFENGNLSFNTMQSSPDDVRVPPCILLLVCLTNNSFSMGLSHRTAWVALVTAVVTTRESLSVAWINTH
jgi:hypothetical protein